MDSLKDVMNFAAIIIALSFLIFSFDDVLLDLYYYVFSRKRLSNKLRIKDLDQAPPKPIAIFVPAWHEEEVIAKMLENNFASINYPRSFYHIFVGVYPNDFATKAAVKPLLAKYKNLHIVENVQDGPTNKSDNLNNLYRKLIQYEHKTGVYFSIVIIHDSEDIIHPTSLKLFNYLIPKHAAVQLPVFPLQPLPTIRNFFKYMTSGTYADEFAENHTKGLVTREMAGGFVPSAGTGFAVSRRILDKLAEDSDAGEIFNQQSLTEDYELSLRMQKIGERIHFFVGSVQRILNSGKVRDEFIATREFFPNNFYPAIKQKARWIYGITFQSAKILETQDLTWMQKYCIVRDWKAKYANLLVLPGYMLLIYIIVSVITGLPNPYQYSATFRWLTFLVTALTIEKQLVRGIALHKIYGWRSAIVGCFAPPLLPLRLVWGNIINFCATVRAWRIWLFGSPKNRAKWDKTDHHYLPTEVLELYRRKLGDLLLEKELVDAAELGSLLMGMEKDKKLGEHLVESNIATHDELLPVLGELLRTGFIDIDKNLVDASLASVFPESVARKHSILPLLNWTDGILVAAAKPLSNEELESLSKETGLHIKVTLAQTINIQESLDMMYRHGGKQLGRKRRIGEILLEKGLVDEEHLLEAFKVQKTTGKRLGQVLVEMNVLSKEQLATVLAESVNISA
ncbi:MAG: glycosyl transferase family protein [Candidatus Aquicultor sp.]|nr:glycosyl transferase family protein [Candidatus Aquicultor sp.]